ncbi:GlxA family transcriptional regulator [Cupriavidus oxalaticus]|uniref:GlxA family transcriptional regulator n=1 Tax=Cupriavidus oxalaticus TaxID=96344 RepID=UPI0031704A44
MKTRTKPCDVRARSISRRVVILGLPPVDALDVIGPAEVFSFANRLKSEFAPYQLELVCASADVNLESETGISLRGHRTLEQESAVHDPIDTLIVASGFESIDRLDPAAIDWIRRRAGSVRRVCSICVGAFALAEAGILKGRKATTHWRLAQHLAERYPTTQVDPAPIWVKDENIYTSAGVSSGIDMALGLVGEDLGDGAALEIARSLVLFLRRPGGQMQFSATLRSQLDSKSSLEKLCVWISENLDSELTIDTLASKSATSVRTLMRMFRRELKTTPAKYVEELRIEAICRALETGGRTLEAIARRTGYQSVDALRKAFVRRVGISPKEYSQRFVPSEV